MNQSDQRGDAVVAAVFEQPAATVLALQTHRQCLDARPERSDALPARFFFLTKLFDARVDHLESLDGAFVIGIEADFTGVEVPDAFLHRVELGLCGIATQTSLVDRLGQPRHFRVDGFDAGTQSVDLTGESSKTFTAVGDGTNFRHVRPFRFCCSIFGGCELVPSSFRRRSRDFDAFEEFGLLGSKTFGARLHLVRVLAAVADRFGVEMTRTLAGDAHGGVDAFGKRGKLEPTLRSRFRSRSQTSESLLLAPEFEVGLVERSRHLVVLFTGRFLVLRLVVQLVSTGHQIVSGQTHLCITQVSLDRLCSPSNLGLASQRFELPTQFRGEVTEASEIGLHGIEFAHRFFLAAAMFEDSRGFFDEGASIFGTGFEDRGEPSLPDDDMHFAADAGVAEQFLDVHQTAGRAVDLVLPRAVAEHPARDRHLGVLDRERPVGVVDGQGHLGAAQRRAAGGAGKDDIFHLAAAQGLGALLAHHPGQRIDDVGFTRAVRADHTGNSRLEPKSRCRRKGFESLECQTLEVHGGKLYRQTGQRSTNPVRSPLAVSQLSTTRSTVPGVVPERSSSTNRSSCVRWPSATTSTRPSR